MAVALNNMWVLDHEDEKSMDDVVRSGSCWRERYVSTDKCALCEQGPGEGCRSVFTGRPLSWSHVQPVKP